MNIRFEASALGVVPTVRGEYGPARKALVEWFENARPQPVHTASEFAPMRWGYGEGLYGHARIIAPDGRTFGVNLLDVD